MLCGLEIGMMVAGLVALITGRFPWLGGKSLRGGAARAFGAVLALPLPLAVGVLYVLAKSGLVPDTAESLQATGAGVEKAAVLGCLLLAVLVGALFAATPPAPLRPGPALMGADPVTEVPLPTPTEGDVDFVALGLEEAGRQEGATVADAVPDPGRPSVAVTVADAPERVSTGKENLLAVVVAVLIVGLLGALYLILMDRQR